MQSTIAKSISKIITQFIMLGSLSKKLIRHGAKVFLGLFALGTLLIVLNRTNLGYDTYVEFIAKSVIKNSFILLAEFIIGGIVIDYILKKK